MTEVRQDSGLLPLDMVLVVPTPEPWPVIFEYANRNRDRFTVPIFPRECTRLAACRSFVGRVRHCPVSVMVGPWRS